MATITRESDYQLIGICVMMVCVALFWSIWVGLISTNRVQINCTYPKQSRHPAIPDRICMISHFCETSNSQVVTIQPCYNHGIDITDVRKIDRDFLDSNGIGRTLTLIITIPVNIQFDNSYGEVIFSGYARHYYFPKIDNRYHYVISSNPIRYIKHLAPINIDR